jgi:hypothetical protein
MRHIRRFLALTVILYMVVSLAGTDRFLNSAIAHVSEPLVIRTMEGEITVGNVQVLSSDSDITITINVDEQYKIYSSVVTFRFNSGGITRAISFGRESDLVRKTDTQHVYSISTDQIKGDNVQVAASAVVIAGGKMYLTPKAFAHVPTATTTTSNAGTSSTSESTATTTTTNQSTTTTNNQGTTTTGPNVTSTTEHQGGGGGGITTTTSAVTSAISIRAVTTTSVRAVAGTTTSTIFRSATATTLTAVTTPTGLTTSSVPGNIPTQRERLPFTGFSYNWYLIGFLLIAAGLIVFSVASRTEHGS